MDYEIVHLSEKALLVLPPVCVSNSDVDLSKKIGQMWHDFSENCSRVDYTVNEKPVCLYSNYKKDVNGKFDPSVGYDVSIGYEIDSFVVKGWMKKIVPASKYAKFVVAGNLMEQVPNSWAKICDMDLPRRFACDFDEYQTNDVINGEVHIYVSLN